MTTPLQLTTAYAVAENAVQLEFTVPVYFTGLLDTHDASQPGLFSMAVVAGTVGLDGTPVQPVAVVSVAQAEGDPLGLVLTFDRPMTASPARYTVSCSPILQSADLSELIDPDASSYTFVSTYRVIEPANMQSASIATTRDIASPFSLESAQASGAPFPNNLLTLGVPVADSTGDYATDQDPVGLKKRILRRCLFIPGVTLHLGRNYGLGLPARGKKLAVSRNVSAIVNDAETQIAQEPDVATVAASVIPFGTTGLYYLRLLVQPRSGPAFGMNVPVGGATVGGT